MKKRIFNPLIVVLLFIILITFIIVSTHNFYFGYGKEANSGYTKDEFSTTPLKLARSSVVQNKPGQVFTANQDAADIDLYSSLNIVKSDLSAGRIREAENRLRDLLVFYPDDRSVLKMLSGMLYLSNRYNEAMYFLQKLIDLYPDDIHARETLALIYEKNNEFEKAIAEFTTISSMTNESITSYVHLAGLYSILKNKDKSLFYFRITYSKIGSNIKNIAYDPVFDNVRNTPEFISILDEAKKSSEPSGQTKFKGSNNSSASGY